MVILPITVSSPLPPPAPPSICMIPPPVKNIKPIPQAPECSIPYPPPVAQGKSLPPPVPKAG